MEYRQLGRSGLKVSVLALGTANFGAEGPFFSKIGEVTPRQARRMLDIAVEHGVNLIDTSNAYSQGRSEEALGAVLKGRSNQIMVSTKVRFSMGEGPNEQGLSRFHIVNECEASLKRLKRDVIDLYLLHQWDGLTPVDETMEALDMLVRQGKVRYVGCSNFSGWHIMKCLMAAERGSLARFVCQQIHYTPESRDAEFELMPIALDQGVGIMVWSPIAGGLLSGKFRKGKPDPKVSRHMEGWGEPPIYDQERLYTIIEALVAAGEAHGVSAAQATLAWTASRPGVSSLVIGARTEEQLKDSLAAASLKLTEAEIKAIEDAGRPNQPYPYWHQCWSAAERLGPADMVMQGQYLATRKKRM